MAREASSPLKLHASTPAEVKERLEAERMLGAMLVYRDEEGRQRIVPLTGDRDRLCVGRGGCADVLLSWDSEVSRTHAELHRLGCDEWAVVDDGLSTNGTYWNGKRVRGRRRLRDGDELRFGRTVVAFRAPAVTESDRTAPAADAPEIELSDTQRRVVVALCRPLCDNAYATPATNHAISREVFLGVDAVKVHLRALYRKVGIEDLPQNEKRARLAELAFHHGLVDERDLDTG